MRSLFQLAAVAAVAVIWFFVLQLALTAMFLFVELDEDITSSNTAPGVIVAIVWMLLWIAASVVIARRQATTLAANIATWLALVPLVYLYLGMRPYV